MISRICGLNILCMNVINSVEVFVLILLQSRKVSFVQHFLYFQGTHEIKFMFRKINISKKKQFYQEIPIENMRYLKQKENISFHQICLERECLSLYPPKIIWHKRKYKIQTKRNWLFPCHVWLWLWWYYSDLSIIPDTTSTRSFFTQYCHCWSLSL